MYDYVYFRGSLDFKRSCLMMNKMCNKGGGKTAGVCSKSRSKCPLSVIIFPHTTLVFALRGSPSNTSQFEWAASRRWRELSMYHRGECGIFSVPFSLGCTQGSNNLIKIEVVLPKRPRLIRYRKYSVSLGSSLPYRFKPGDRRCSRRSICE